MVCYYRKMFAIRTSPNKSVLCKRCIGLRRISRQQSSPFSPLRPVNPASLPHVPAKKSKWLRRSVYAVIIGSAGLFLDKQYNASALIRTFRAIYTSALVVVDYKWNFNAANADNINDLHQRVANRLLDMIRKNGGLYIKAGQAIGMQAAVLPSAYAKAFQTLFDNTPQVGYDEVKSVFQKEFGKSPDEIFKEFNHKASASASIAQVHKAVLPTGEVVAVKVQKPEIEKQIFWDLATYRLLMYAYDKIFDIRLYFTVDYVSKHLLGETDFVQEAKNAEILADFVAKEPRLSRTVHIPKVYDDYCSGRVLTAEWIDGIKITDKKELEKAGFNVSKVMHAFVSLFAAQIFRLGHVHCDPHPGNVLVRAKNGKRGKAEVVLLDHGLYIHESEEFRITYCKLWRALLTYDYLTVTEIVKSWGVDFPELFGSMTLMQPWGNKLKGNKKLADEDKLTPVKTTFEQQEEMKAQLQQFLQNTEKIPLEIIFLERNMRIVQLINLTLGSPVNRPVIMARWASESLKWQTDLTWKGWMREWLDHAKFSFSMFLLSLGYWYQRTVQYLTGGRANGIEDLLQYHVKSIAKENFGIEINDDLFLA